MVGRLTRSIAATSLGVSGPWRSIVARAATEVGVSGAVSPPPGAGGEGCGRSPVRSLAADSASRGVGGCDRDPDIHQRW